MPSRFTRPKSESQAEVARRRGREDEDDESVSSFMKRRFGRRGEELTKKLLSAVLHGIYAASPDSLSVRSVMPVLWDTESRHGGLARALLPKWANKRYRQDTKAQLLAKKEAERELKKLESEVGQELWSGMKGVSVYSFKEGIEVITRAMQRELEANHNVSIIKGAAVQSVDVDEQGQVHVSHSLKCARHTSLTRYASQLQTSAGAITATRLLSALPSPALDSALSSSVSLPWLSSNPSSTVGVVNVTLPSWLVGARRLLTIEGFGYLIPSATPNPSGILGVVFDSDSLPIQDASAKPGEGTPTKFSVMIGGPHWRSLLSRGARLPSEEELISAAHEALAAHLSIPSSLLSHPDTYTRASLQHACIPTYAPGHPSRMRALHSALTAHAKWEGRLALLGASYTGVSLNDCVLGARRTARRVVREERGGAGRTTGLERFARAEVDLEPRTDGGESGLMPSVS